MKNSSELLLLLKRIHALSENVQHYSDNEYDLDRHKEIDRISRQMISLLANFDPEKVNSLLPERNGYRTPKVDVRAVIFNGQLLINLKL